LKLSVVIAEAGLELVPREIQKTPAVVKDAARRGLEPQAILLDRSFHHSAMSKLKEDFKRGRPDLVHTTLLSVTGSPLYLEGRAMVCVHCHGDVVIEFEPGTRIPKSYFRFRGLAEQALSEGGAAGLVRVYRSNFGDLISKRLEADKAWGLSVQGRQCSLEDLASEMVAHERPCAVIGGFPHGHFSAQVLQVCDDLVRIHARPLEAHVVASRLVYEVEKQSSILSSSA